MAMSRKKVILRKLDQSWLTGYLWQENGQSLPCHAGKLELLELAGYQTDVLTSQVKWVCLVREFNSGMAHDPERLLRKTFLGRPRGEGLALRLTLIDGDTLEGIATNDRSLLGPDGLLLTPPDTRGNTLRLWIPQSSITSLTVLALLGRTKPRPGAYPDGGIDSGTETTTESGTDHRDDGAVGSGLGAATQIATSGRAPERPRPGNPTPKQTKQALADQPRLFL